MSDCAATSQLPPIARSEVFARIALVSAFQKSPAILRRKRIWPVWASACATLAALPFAIYWVDAVFPLFLGGAGVLCVVALIASCTWVNEPGAAVAADRSGLYLNHRRVVARRAVRAASVHLREGGAVVRLVTSWRPFEVLVEDVDEGSRLLEALGLSSRTSVARYFMLWGRYREYLLVGLRVVGGILLSTFCSVGVLGFLAGRPLASALTAEAAALVLLSWLLMRSAVWFSVGQDGVTFRRGLARARFIPVAEIDSVEGNDTDVVMRLRNGSSIVVSRGPVLRRWGREQRGTSADVVARVNDALASHRRRDAVRHVLARGGRDAAEWIRGLRALGGESPSSRQAAVPAEVLWRVLEDPRASETERAGSAIALQTQLDVADRVRIGEVGDACVSPRLRVALRSLGAGESAESLASTLSMMVDASAPDDVDPAEVGGSSLKSSCYSP